VIPRAEGIVRATARGEGQETGTDAKECDRQDNREDS